MKFLIILLTVFLVSCSTKKLQLSTPVNSITGSEFYTTAVAFNWQQRDSLAIVSLLDGNMPSFNTKFVPIHTSIIGPDQKIIHATYFVLPDYLSIGSNKDWARIPLTPMAAQLIADSLHCFLPTKKMVDEIYIQSKVKLAPVPMYAFRDSTITMWQHHLIIEGQRKGQKGLIGGIKKDVVLSNIVLKGPKTNKVAIYGWHQLNGKTIQPVYAGHVNWYVDYSHGIRLVMDQIIVDGKKMDYKKLLLDSNLRAILTDEVNPMLRY
jgi:hypothetical protein